MRFCERVGRRCRPKGGVVLLEKCQLFVDVQGIEKIEKLKRRMHPRGTTRAVGTTGEHGRTKMNADGNVSRGDWIKTAGVAGLTAAATSGSGAAPAATRATRSPPSESTRTVCRQCLVGSITGGARLQLNRPPPQEISLVNDRPWEGGHMCLHEGLPGR
ncbi:MAG: hypothetical protein CM1200mP2_41220 [Planctomycetaceae bacterium]|nr:MAG: hypothetical protein CM1200mP2_41220 [Planctomycetaceae bacterium]